MTALDELATTPFHEADDALRSRILSRLANTELFAALLREPDGDLAELKIFDLPDFPAALACDTEDRLAAFFEGPVVHLGAPGRVLAARLAEQGRGLLVNPGLPSEMLLDPATLSWLGRALTETPPETDATQPLRLFAPEATVVTILAGALAERLQDMAGLVGESAILGAEWPEGRRGHLILVRGVAAEHQPPIAKALAELLTFLPQIEGGVDVAFSDRAAPSDALVIEAPKRPEPVAPPKRDPSAPPRLR